jgi:hypothetical protein
MRGINLPLLKQSWIFSARHALWLAPFFVLCGYLNDAIMSIGGASHSQMSVILSQLKASGCGIESLMAIDQSVGGSQNPGHGIAAIGLLLFAASIELVLMLGLMHTRQQGETPRLAQQLAFFRQGFTGSFKGFWRGFLRFLLFSFALAIGIVATVILNACGTTEALVIMGLLTALIFLWMMVFLLPYIFATIACVFRPLAFDEAFRASVQQLTGRRLEVVLSLCVSGLPAGAVTVGMAWQGLEPSLAPLSIALTSVLGIPSLALLYLYHLRFQEGTKA